MGFLYLLRLPGFYGACLWGPQSLSPCPALSFIGWEDASILLELLRGQGDFRLAAASLGKFIYTNLS